MALPPRHLAPHDQSCAGAVRFRWIPGIFLVGQVWVILECAGGFHDVYPARSRPQSQFRAPDRRIQRRRKVDKVRLNARPVIRAIARPDQIAGVQIGTGTMVKRCTAIVSVFVIITPYRRMCVDGNVYLSSRYGLLDNLCAVRGSDQAARQWRDARPDCLRPQGRKQGIIRSPIGCKSGRD